MRLSGNSVTGHAVPYDIEPCLDSCNPCRGCQVVHAGVRMDSFRRSFRNSLSRTWAILDGAGSRSGASGSQFYLVAGGSAAHHVLPSAALRWRALSRMPIHPRVLRHIVRRIPHRVGIPSVQLCLLCPCRGLGSVASCPMENLDRVTTSPCSLDSIGCVGSGRGHECVRHCARDQAEAIIMCPHSPILQFNAFERG